MFGSWWRRRRASARLEGSSAASVLPGHPLSPAATPAPTAPGTTVERPAPGDPPAAPSGPIVGLVFGDGTEVLLDASDPRTARFAALADELNR